MTNPSPPADLEKLLRDLLASYDPRYGLGAMTCSTYDTAWVANVTKTVDGLPQYLFPASFLSILQAQQSDGSWSSHFSSNPDEEDGLAEDAPAERISESILSTMAATYTLILHSQNEYQIPRSRLPAPDLNNRIARAVSRLKVLLRTWDADRCNTVGFEVLAPTLLDLLESVGYSFTFPGRESLLRRRSAKLKRVCPKILYEQAPSALLHSLEAFHSWNNDEFDVTKIKHHTVKGSVMASPAATASYLMKHPHWDDSAEAYLRLVIERGEGSGSGRVPSAWPSTHFEILWVVSSLMESGLWQKYEMGPWDDIVSTVIHEARVGDGGSVGFAQGIEPDLDDSAKASIILSLLGQRGFTETIVDSFDSVTCLKTYAGERDPSLSANCNALLSLMLDDQEYAKRTPSILKIVHYVSGTWRSGHENLKDKWNLSPFYPAMLVCRSFAELLHQWSTGNLKDVTGDLIRDKVIPTISGCVRYVVNNQADTGFWGSYGPYEETCYAILALASVIALPLPRCEKERIRLALRQGHHFLQRQQALLAPEPLWIEKTTYGSKYLREAYRQAAFFAAGTLGNENQCSAHEEILLEGETLSSCIAKAMAVTA